MVASTRMFAKWATITIAQMQVVVLVISAEFGLNVKNYNLQKVEYCDRPVNSSAYGVYNYQLTQARSVDSRYLDFGYLE